MAQKCGHMFIVGLRLGRVEGVNIRPVNNGPFSIDGREDGMAGDQITVAELLARRTASRKSADVAGNRLTMPMLPLDGTGTLNRGACLSQN